jgi:glycerol kinase
MTDKYILALDEGTTSARAIIFDRAGNVVTISQREFAQIYPKPGWVEHDPEVIWETQLAVAREAIAGAGLQATDIAAIGITNQRESTVIWERDTGRAIYNSICWQDRRTAGQCDALKARGLEGYVAETTGLVVDAYFSGTKIAWILDNVPGARERAEKGELLFGTIDSWLIWKLTGGKVHATDVTNASRTLLFNIHTVDWDDRLLSELNVPRAVLPQVHDTSHVFGTTSPELFGAEIPVGSAVGDQQAALFGHACFERGMAKCTYGTAASLVMNTGSEPVKPGNGLLTTVAVSLDGKVHYAIEGVLFICGAAIQWLRDELKIIDKSSEAVATTDDTCGVYFVPAFTGMSAPLWDAYARGTIVGLTRGANREHLIRAALESMAYQVHDVVLAMESQSETRVSSIRCDGGSCTNDFVMQFQADLSNLPILRPVVTEAAARGAAFLAGLAVGYWKDTAELSDKFELERTFEREMDAAKADKLYAGWTKAVQRSLAWVDPEDANA